jgi:hypothetical protein
MRGVQKHDKRIPKNKSDPPTPTHHGGPRFFFCRPLGRAPRSAVRSLQSTVNSQCSALCAMRYLLPIYYISNI